MSARYFPVAQEINSDPEGWELTDTFGDRMLRVWLQLLAIGDRERGIIKGTVEGWAPILARQVYSKGNPKWFRRDSETVQKALRWMSEKGWIAIRDGSEPALVIVNYAKFHKVKAEKSHAPNLSSPTPTPKDEPAPPAPSAHAFPKAEVKTGLDPAIKDVADRIYFSDRKKFAKLVVWIKEAQRERFRDSVIAAALKQFERYAATVDPWYPYLDKIIYKVEAATNARESEKQSEEYKQELADYAQELKH